MQATRVFRSLNSTEKAQTCIDHIDKQVLYFPFNYPLMPFWETYGPYETVK